MPYIPKIHRSNFLYEDAGDLNYALTKCCLDYLYAKSLSYPRIKINYQRINDIIGALDCCKLEFMRRVMIPYEDTKIQENGDVGYDSVFDRKSEESGSSQDLGDLKAEGFRGI